MKSIFQIVASIACAVALTACGGGGGGSDTPATTTPTQPVFSKTDTVVGTGIEAAAGDKVTIHYTGYLYSETASGNKGTQFESSVGSMPFSFTVGRAEAIPGMDQGVVGMKAGGKRTVIMPASMAYGSTPQVKIPANSALVFDVQMVTIQR